MTRILADPLSAARLAPSAVCFPGCSSTRFEADDAREFWCGTCGRELSGFLLALDVLQLDLRVGQRFAECRDAGFRDSGPRDSQLIQRCQRFQLRESSV